MAIETREAIVVGTKLTARYKNVLHTATVVDPPSAGEGETQEAGLFFKVDGLEKVFSSPSSAASAVMDGKAANGWRFWSIAGTETVKAPKVEKAPKVTKAIAKPAKKLIRKGPNQKNLEDGQVRYFCETCVESFIGGATMPEACPKGHGATAPASEPTPILDEDEANAEGDEATSEPEEIEQLI